MLRNQPLHGHPNRALGLALSAALAGSLASATATAQTPSGFALDRYEPSTTGDPFFVAEHPWYNRTRIFSAGITADFTRNPLVFRPPMSDPRVVIDNMLVLHASAAIALFDRVAISASLPFSLLQTAGAAGGNPSPIGLMAYTAGPAPGDPRLGARVRIFGQSDEDPISLHVGGQLFFGVIPWSGDEHWVTDEVMRGRAYATGAGRAGPVRYSLSLGYHFRRRTELYRSVMDGDFFVTAGAALIALDGRLHVGPEFWANIVPASFGQRNIDATVNAEATLGISYTIANLVQLGVAGGPGLSSSVGTPTFRGLFRVAYTPFSEETAARTIRPDRDGDGVVDEEDQCPDETSSPRPDVARPGCALARVDSDDDGVFDDVDLCPNEPVGRVRDPGRPGCSLADRDDDGVADTLDQCVDQPRGEHEASDRAGCPDVDTDSDGVFDSEDQCPQSAISTVADPERAGCAAPDRDHDTVPDHVDRCADQPGIPQANAEQNGCPTALLSFDGRQLRVSEPVRFRANAAELLPSSLPTLDAIAAAINALPASIRVIDVQSHEADDRRRDAALNLSQRRADAVRAYLVAHGVAPTRLNSHGFGGSRPIVETRSLRGAALQQARAQNLRTELVVIDPAPAAEAPAASPQSTTAPSSQPSNASQPAGQPVSAPAQ
ncbi:MAG: OmpA family protein [Polyangiales bacterium]